MTEDYVDPISKALGAATPISSLPRPVTDENLPATVEKESEEPREIEDDYQEARSNIKELIAQAMEQIPDLVNLMSQSQSDKMISAVSGFIKTAGDLNLNLSRLSKDIKTPKYSKNGPTTPTGVPEAQTATNIVYVGTTEEILRKIREDRKNQPPVDAEFVEVKQDENDS